MAVFIKYCLIASKKPYNRKSFVIPVYMPVYQAYTPPYRYNFAKIFRVLLTTLVKNYALINSIISNFASSK